MSQWFYAAPDGQRQGPLPAEDIVGLYRAGRIHGSTLAWREGASGWQPLHAYAAELGLPAQADSGGPTSSPPLPPPPPLQQQQQQQQQHHGDPPAPWPRLSGCVIAVIIAAVAGVILLGILGILAAIAIPAYQDYTLRAQTSATYSQLLPLRTQLVELVQQNQRCPVNGDAGFGSADSYAGTGLASLRIGRFDNNLCGLEAYLQATGHPHVDGKRLWLDYDADTGDWECSSEVDDRFLPLDCRG